MTATLAAALLVPFTFFLDPVPAIAAIITMSAMTIFAGDIPSALLRIPGTPSSAAYTEDAYALTRNGKGAVGLGVSLRSEEHTSELQSRGHLVCRLLLEKKKNIS